MSAGRARRRVAQRLPSSVAERMRRAQQQWGTITAGRRMMPSFIVVGAQRCGTTTLYRLLSDHPDLVRPTMAKGIGYFDVNYDRGERWYRGHFPVAERHHGDGRGRLAFESSGYYCFHPLAAGRIAADLPEVKVVMMVRDPVERAHSAYKHERARGYEDLEFEAALDAEAARLDGEVERMVAEPGYQSFHHRHHAYVGRGRYAEQVARLDAALGADRVRLLDADRFFDDPRREFGALTDWLGLSAWDPPTVPQENARPSAALSDGLRDRLSREFVDSDEELVGHLGRPPSWRG